MIVAYLRKDCAQKLMPEKKNVPISWHTSKFPLAATQLMLKAPLGMLKAISLMMKRDRTTWFPVGKGCIWRMLGNSSRFDWEVHRLRSPWKNSSGLWSARSSQLGPLGPLVLVESQDGDGHEGLCPTHPVIMLDVSWKILERIFARSLIFAARILVNCHSP